MTAIASGGAAPSRASQAIGLKDDRSVQVPHPFPEAHQWDAVLAAQWGVVQFCQARALLRCLACLASLCLSAIASARWLP